MSWSIILSSVMAAEWSFLHSYVCFLEALEVLGAVLALAPSIKFCWDGERWIRVVSHKNRASTNFRLWAHLNTKICPREKFFFFHFLEGEAGADEVEMRTKDKVNWVPVSSFSWEGDQGAWGFPSLPAAHAGISLPQYSVPWLYLGWDFVSVSLLTKEIQPTLYSWMKGIKSKFFNLCFILDLFANFHFLPVWDPQSWPKLIRFTSTLENKDQELELV